MQMDGRQRTNVTSDVEVIHEAWSPAMSALGVMRYTFFEDCSILHQRRNWCFEATSKILRVGGMLDCSLYRCSGEACTLCRSGPNLRQGLA